MFHSIKCFACDISVPLKWSVGSNVSDHIWSYRFITRSESVWSCCVYSILCMQNGIKFVLFFSSLLDGLKQTHHSMIWFSFHFNHHHFPHFWKYLDPINAHILYSFLHFVYMLTHISPWFLFNSVYSTASRKQQQNNQIIALLNALRRMFYYKTVYFSGFFIEEKNYNEERKRNELAHRKKINSQN